MMLEMMIDFGDYINSDEQYYIYGTTSLGSFIYEKIVASCGKECVLGFLETYPTVKSYLGKRVFSLHEMEHEEKAVKIILASATHFKDMKNQLISSGFSEEKIIIPYKLFDYFKTVYGRKGSSIRKICFWPPVNEDNEDLFKKIAWFCPDKRIKVSVWCNENTDVRFRNSVCCESINNADKIFREADVIYIWKTERDKKIYEKYMSKTYIVDPNFYLYIETLNYIKLYYNSFSEAEKEKYRSKSREIFLSLMNSTNGYSKAKIFCSGPSIDEIRCNTYEDSINIICNSMVKDKEWLKKIMPRIMTFTDPNYYLSPNDYCKKFFEDVLDGYRLYGYYIIVYEYEVPLLLAHYPELSGKIIGISNNADSITFPSKVQLKVKSTKNILTEMMVPVASALCDHVEIAGCTGRNSDEKFYWKHNNRTQYVDLMQSIFDMYPSLFRDQSYADYYEYHCQCLEQLLEYGEKRGKSYKNITTSYIPALINRTVPN